MSLMPKRWAAAGVYQPVRHEPGERLTLEVMRDNKLRRLEVTSGDRADFFRQP